MEGWKKYGNELPHYSAAASLNTCIGLQCNKYIGVGIYLGLGGGVVGVNNICSHMREC